MAEITFDPPVANAYPIGVLTDDNGQLGSVPAFSEGELDLEERQDSLVGRIAGEVARAISEGELQPGADLNSVELASRFGTSRTPVREALMLLEKEGLVEIPPRRRPRVAQISLAEVEELYEIRSALNGLMMRQFVRNASDEELQGAVEIYRTMCRHA